MNHHSALTLLFASVLAPLVSAQEPAAFDCRVLGPQDVLRELDAAVEAGSISIQPPPAIAPGPPAGGAAAVTGGCLTREHIFPFEDTNQLLLTNFSIGELLGFMTDAANSLMATHGDRYDFVGYWVNFTPDHQIGGAFYALIENDVLGIGLPLFNNRPAMGLGGVNIEGYVMMWNINSSHWEPGAGSGADFTRLVLGQEFEHRFAMFLPDLLDGRPLQGNDGNCGRSSHWNFRVDGQGSGMEIAEWVGANPATRIGGSLNFNADIGGVFSHTDLYLMGYESGAEMDAGNSELRYMDGSTSCGPTHSGTISTFTSAEIVASAGTRIPGSTSAQQHFRTGWIMIHLPGAAPTTGQLDKAIGILEQHELDWAFGTLGRGTMDNALFDDCNCNGVPDSGDISMGTSADLNGNSVPDECEQLGSSYCTPAVPNSTGSSAELAGIGSDVATANDLTLVATSMPMNQFGYFLASETQGLFMPPGSQGNFCLGSNVARFNAQVQNSGVAGAFQIAVDLTAIPTSPPSAVVAGDTWNFQGWFRDVNPGNTSNFTDGLSILFE